jgi:hypothetical protein
MSQLEFSLILVSIVMGIAIAEILATFGRMLRHRHEKPLYWVQVGWMGLVLFAIAVYWWSEFQLGRLADLEFWGYLVGVFPYAGQVVLVYILCEDPATMKHADHEAAFFAHSRLFFYATAALVVFGALAANTVRGQPWFSLPMGVRAIALPGLIYLAHSDSRRAHAAVLIAITGLALVFSVGQFY